MFIFCYLQDYLYHPYMQEKHLPPHVYQYQHQMRYIHRLVREIDIKKLRNISNVDKSMVNYVIIVAMMFHSMYLNLLA